MTKVDNIGFTAGMMPDIDRLSKMPNTYLDALNILRDDTGNVMNECGTESVHSFVNNKTVVGVHNLNDEIIVASTDNNDHEIGVITNGVYTKYVSHSSLGFNKANRVNMEAKVIYNGNRMLYIAGKNITLRAINLDSIPNESEFAKATSLFLEYNLPFTEIDSISEGGSVVSGIYQFATRLVSDGDSKTSFGPTSGLIPVGTGSLTGNKKDYDGGPQGTPTNQKITVKVSNIDKEFDYVELCIITYLNEDNILSINSLGKVAVLGRNELQFTYTGKDMELESISQIELTADTASYSYAEHIAQKDNTLLLANLEETVDPIDWQEIANNITINYVVHSINSNESIDIAGMREGTYVHYKELNQDTQFKQAGDADWTDVSTNKDFEDYKNPLVCSKYVGYKRDEVYSLTFTPVYFTGRKGKAVHIPAKTPLAGSKMLGAVTAQGFTYPSSFGTLAGTPVKYHKMPSNSTVPFFTTGRATIFSPYKTTINILGIEVQIPDINNWSSKVAGYIIGRESRIGKETIVAQGFIKNIYAVNGGANYSIVPSCGRMYIVGTDRTDRRTTSGDHKQIFTFDAPDLITEDKEFVPSSLRHLYNLVPSIEFASTNDVPYKRTKIGNLLSFKSASYVGTTVPLEPQVVDIKSASISPTDNPREGGDNINITYNAFGITLAGRRFQKTKVLKVAGSSNIPRSGNDGFDLFTDREVGTTGGIAGIGGTDNDGYLYEILNTDNSLGLYEILRNSTTYYGDIYNKESFPIYTVLFNKGNKNIITGAPIGNLTSICFGGDTFISRYAHTFKDTIAFYGEVGNRQDIPKTESTVYYLLESKFNYNFRHFLTVSDNTSGSVPYYPKYKIFMNSNNTGICDYPVSYGLPELYNKQYSAQNNLQLNYTDSIDADVVSKFTNRIVYSNISIEGDKIDAYKIFPVLNYHDIPKNFGDITNLFIQGNELYVHTTRALFRSFYNSLSTQATSEGDIVLGTGGAFPRPSIPLLTQSGGYAGCKNSGASVDTPSGRYFYDASQSKLFVMGEGLAEISNPAIFEYLRNNWNSSTVILGYDKGRKRILMSNDTETISYRLSLSSFESRHSYTFHHFISAGVTDYIINSGKIDKINSKVFGRYFGNYANSFIKVNSVVHPALSKRYTHVEMVITSTDVSGVNLPFDFISEFKAYSLERNSGSNIMRVIKDYTEDLETLGNIFVYKANNKFRFGFPPDVVYDINNNIQDPANLVTHPSYTDEDRIFLPDLIDNHMIMELVMYNNVQRSIKINSFIVNFEPNIT